MFQRAPILGMENSPAVLLLTWVLVALGCMRGRAAAPFKLVPGHISGEAKGLGQKETTLLEALKFCDHMPDCLAITTDHEPKDDKQTQLFYFKQDDTVHFSQWASYVHTERAKHHNKASDAPPGAHQMQPSSGSGFLAKLPPLISEPEPPPDELYNGDVINIVGNTFEGIVRQGDNDVVVNFYAPWCGHCQVFKKQYKELARRLKHVKTLTLTQIDATRNLIPDIPVFAFPTIILFPAKQKSKPVVFRVHDRSPEAMTTWLHQEATHRDFPDEPPAGEKQASTEGDSGLLLDAEDL